MNLSDFLSTGIGQKVVKVAIILIGGLVGLAFSKKGLDLFFDNLKKKSGLKSYKKRIETLRSLLNNVVSILLIAIVSLMILRDLGFDIVPILTGAGILGLAVSFGSQSLVKDLVSGFFIILENQFNVDDYVKIDGAEGTVHQVNLRTTVLKDEDDNLIYLPNSSINKVVVFKEKK